MKRIEILLCFVIFNLLIFGSDLLSQNVTTKILTDTNNILIGDQATIKLSVHSDAPVNIILPAFPDTLGKLEVISRSSIDTVKSGYGLTLNQKYVVTSFDSGLHVFPSLTIMYEKKEQTTLYPVLTDSLFIKFNAVNADTSKAIKDIKPPLEEPYTLADFIDYILIGLGIIILAAAIIYYFKKRKPKDKSQPVYDPKIPPYILALEALKNLENEKLWQKGQVKKYHIKLTEIIRTYIEREFKIPALEMTTDEIVSSLGNNGFNDELIIHLRKAHEISDLVKFAKYQPIPDENSLCMKDAIEFVNRTKPGNEVTNHISNSNDSKL
jgi:hypothetical protein